MPLQFFAPYNTELDSSNVCESGGKVVSCCICEEAIGESSWAQAPRHGPEGSVKAARRFTIAPQQGEGDWKTSIREAGMDGKWLKPISPGADRPREGIYEVEKQMMTGTKARHCIRGSWWKPHIFSPQHKSLLQLKSMQKHPVKLWFSWFILYSQSKGNWFKKEKKGSIGMSFN